jgi:hypothetical protein
MGSRTARATQRNPVSKTKKKKKKKNMFVKLLRLLPKILPTRKQFPCFFLIILANSIP